MRADLGGPGAITLDLGDRRAEPIGDAERGELLELFGACEDYVRLAEGRAPSDAQVEELLRSLPPGKAPADKHVLGLRDRAGRLVGAIDFVRDYPAPGEWFLGLLLLRPEERGSGLGERAYRAVEAFARERGASVVRIAVADQNIRARAFWERLGFAPEYSRQVHTGERESLVWRMVKRVGA